MSTLTTTIDPRQFDNPIHRGMHVLAELKRKGIPVVGVIGVEGVEYGVLSIESPDLVTGEVVYSWND